MEAGSLAPILIITLISTFAKDIWCQNVETPPELKYKFVQFVNNSIVIEDEVSLKQELHVAFEVQRSELFHKSPRIITSAKGDLSVNVRNPCGQQDNWHHDARYPVDEVAKTLWTNITLDIPIRTKYLFTIVFSTLRKASFNVTVSLVGNRLNFHEPQTAVTSPTAPYVWQFDAEETLTRSVLVQVSSPQSKLCGLVSIQRLNRSYHDTNDDITIRSRWQTMLSTAVIDVKLNKGFDEGFYVVVITRDSDKECLGYNVGFTDRRKEVTVVLSHNDSELNLWSGSLLVVTSYLFACGLALVMALCFAIPLEGAFVTTFKAVASRTGQRIRRSTSRPGRRKRDQETAVSTIAQNAEAPDKNHTIIDASGLNHVLDDAIDDAIDDEPTEVDGIPLSRMKPMTDIDSFIQDVLVQEVKTIARRVINQCSTPMAEECKEEGSAPKHPDHATCKQQVIEIMFRKQRQHQLKECKKRRRCEDLNIKDLATSFDKELYPNTLKMKSSLYFWIILLISIFYTIPVVQLLLSNQKIASEEGNLDLCYFNFKCKVRTSLIEDYGHVFSNIAYVISGIFFVIMVSIREKRYREYLRLWNEAAPEEDHKQYGVPEQYGIFYALGISLAMEGVLSACYHICPTHVNFQYDTTFMYVISVLVFLKVYQFRHPDITSNAHVVFTVIGLALIIEVFGYYFDSYLVFWILFIIVYIKIVLIFTIHTYYNGMACLLKQEWKTMIQEIRNNHFEAVKPARKHKFLLSCLVIALNVSFAVFFFFRKSGGVSRYLLVILMVNMLAYVAYYCAMKVYYRRIKKVTNEAISRISAIYFLASLLTMAIGVYFFSQARKSSSKTPAESRDLNAPCTFLFFDDHDIWHFASAASLFFIFMMILTLEDNNLKSKWDDITVF